MRTAEAELISIELGGIPTSARSHIGTPYGSSSTHIRSSAAVAYAGSDSVGRAAHGPADAYDARGRPRARGESISGEQGRHGGPIGQLKKRTFS